MLRSGLLYFYMVERGVDLQVGLIRKLLATADMQAIEVCRNALICQLLLLHLVSSFTLIATRILYNCVPAIRAESKIRISGVETR